MIFLVFSIFFATLSNHSGNTILLSLGFSIVAVLFYLNNRFKYPRIIWFHLCLVYVIGSGLLFSIGIPQYDVAPEFESAFLSNLIKYVLLVFLIYTYVLIIKNKPKIFLKSCVWVLSIHLILFYIQFVTAYVSGFYIDFVAPFTGDASRYKFYGLGGTVDLFRCTGLFIEPSTYAVSIYCLHAIIRLNPVYNGNSNKLLKAALVSIFLSLSTISILIIVLHLAFYYAPKLLNLKRSVALSVFTVLISFGVMQTELYSIQVEKTQNTSGIRFALVDAVLERPQELLILGSGLYGIENNIILGSRGVCPENTDCGTQINRDFASPADSGLLFYLFIKFGFFSLVIIILVVYPLLINFNFSKLSVIFIVLLTKIQFAFPLIWILIIVLRSDFEKNSSSNEMVT